MPTALFTAVPRKRDGGSDIAFAGVIILILCAFFLPVPAFMIDVGLAFSIALSVVILMVALWIQRPLEFSAFPTVLLVATILRLALNIATTRLILSRGAQGGDAAGHIIAGFANLIMRGDFVIGIIVFLILVTINFVVITKGATRIAEVGARFTLDAVPGKQMAIDADLSAGLIDEKVARERRRELEEESSFFGSMDGASKFVRGDAIAGLIILAVNVFGGIIIGVTRHQMSAASAADIFTKLSVGDGIVSQIPALIISLASGLLVAKGGARGSAEKAVLDQLGRYPRALYLSSGLMGVLALMPGLPFAPFMLLGGMLAFAGASFPRRAAEHATGPSTASGSEASPDQGAKDPIGEQLRSFEIELCLSKELTTRLLASHEEIASRMVKIRRNFARQFGFVIPDIKLTDNLSIPPKCYQIKIHGTVVATQELRLGEFMVIVGDGEPPSVPCEELREPAFGMTAVSIAEAYQMEVKRQGFKTVDAISVLLTHLSEIVRGNLAQLLSYRDVHRLLDRLEPEYKRLVDEICPSHISHSGIQAVLKALLAERISIRNMHLILEAIAEVAPHLRRVEQIAEHARLRLAQQICGDLLDDGALKVLRPGARWDRVLQQSLKRDAKGEVIEFDIEPKLIEQFATEASEVIKARMREGHSFALVTTAETRPYARMMIERMFPTLPVLSQLEIARGFEVKSLGSIGQ
jgi:flagellar biosynthesis protein FlhA